MESAVELADVLVGAAERVARALRCLRTGAEPATHLVEVHRLEDEGDRTPSRGGGQTAGGGRGRG
jgi:hypothetical protein